MFLIALNEESFYNLLNGELRNIILYYFKNNRLNSKCQIKGCKETNQLHSAHLIDDRPAIFIREAAKFKTKHINGYYIFDVYHLILAFLFAHSKKNSVCFLCSKHHREFHIAEKNKNKLSIFKKRIIL